MDVAALSGDEGDSRDGVSVHGTWISHTSAAAAPEMAKKANMRVQRIIRQLTALCDLRINT